MKEYEVFPSLICRNGVEFAGFMGGSVFIIGVVERFSHWKGDNNA